MEKLIQFLEQIVNWKAVALNGGRILLILAIAVIVLAAIGRILSRVEARLTKRFKDEGDSATEASKRVETIVKLIRQAARLMVWGVALLVALGQMKIEIAPILASAGILGLAVGFGAQNLVRDVISGFFFLLENQVRVGDVAVINGTGGLVEGVNFRTIVLRDLTGAVHVFPNGTVTTLSNLTRTWSAYVFDIGVAYKENTDRVVEILKEVGQGLMEDEYFGKLVLEPPEVFGVDKFSDSAVMIKGRIKTKPIRQWEVGRQFLRRVKQAFDREGIEIPFPHQTLYFGEASKPFAVQMLERAANRQEPS